MQNRRPLKAIRSQHLAHSTILPRTSSFALNCLLLQPEVKREDSIWRSSHAWRILWEQWMCCSTSFYYFLGEIDDGEEDIVCLYQMTFLRFSLFLFAGTNITNSREIIWIILLGARTTHAWSLREMWIYFGRIDVHYSSSCCACDCRLYRASEHRASDVSRGTRRPSPSPRLNSVRSSGRTLMHNLKGSRWWFYLPSDATI